MENDLALTIIGVKAVEEDGELYISGYANTIDKDRYGDIVLPSAFDMDNYVKNPILLLQHDHKKPIGKVVEHEITDKGLWIKALVSSAAEDLYKVKTLITDGVLKALSIGFRMKNGKYIAEDDVYVITELELMEISVVSVPANQDSLFEVSKSFGEKTASAKELVMAELAVAEKAAVTTVTTTDVVTTEQETTVTTETVEVLDDNTDTPKSDSETERKNTKEEVINMTPEEVKAATKLAVADALENARLEDEAKALALATSEKEAKDVADKVKADAEAQEKAIADAVTAALAAKDATDEKEAGMSADRQTLETTVTLSLDQEREYVKQVDDLYLLSMLIEKPMSALNAFKALPEQIKAVVNAAGTSLAPQGFDVRLMEDIRKALKIEPLFSNFNMPLADYRLPFNAAGVTAEWIAPGTAPADQSASFNSVLFTAKKLMSAVAFNYEDEDDSVVAMLPTIRTELAYGMAELLETTLVSGTGAANNFRGFSHYAAGAGASHTYTVAGTAAADFTPANVASARSIMGRYGLDPSKVVLLINLQDYYKLVDDTLVSTVQNFGPQATALKGQLATIWGIPVIPTEAIATPVNVGDVRAILIRPDRFKVGYRKALNVEAYRLPTNQTKSLTASLRADFNPLVPLTAGQLAADQTFVVNIVVGA